MSRIIRLNMTEKTVREEACPEKYRLLGGRGLSSSIISEEVPPACDPLGPFNKLIIAPGMMAGGLASSSNRLSIGAKSPLTGGIKESNGGGTTAITMARHDIKGIVVEGQAGDGPYCLFISEEGIALEKVEEIKGLNTFDTADRLKEKYGDKTAMALIGPAGEEKMAAAGVTNLDMDGLPNRYCGRGGMGAVMGSKGLKAVVITHPKTDRVVIKDTVRFNELIKEFAQKCMENPVTGKRLPIYGTAGVLDQMQSIGALPTRNFRAGVFEGAEKIGSQALRDLILQRGGAGNPTHACMPGCVVRCSNRFPDAKGNYFMAPMEFETMGMMGSNLGIDDLDTIAEMNRICNLIGVDTMETGAALGVCAEAGLASFGDGPRFIELVNEIARGTMLGRVIGQGAAVTGKVLGVSRVPAVKGQSLAAYEPRHMKANGVVFSTSPMGADHTAGNALKTNLDPLTGPGQATVSRELQISMAAYDSLGFCILIGSAIGPNKEVVLGLINARLDTEWTWQDVVKLGKSVLVAELDFNRRAGFTPADDRLPEFMYGETVPPHNSTWDVPEDELLSIWAPLFNADQ